MVSTVGGLSDGSRLLLEIGRPPLPNQVLNPFAFIHSNRILKLNYFLTYLVNLMQHRLLLINSVVASLL